MLYSYIFNKFVYMTELQHKTAFNMQKHLSQVRTEAEHRLPTVVEDLEPTGFRRLRTRRPWVTLKNSLYILYFDT